MHCIFPLTIKLLPAITIDPNLPIPLHCSNPNVQIPVGLLVSSLPTVLVPGLLDPSLLVPALLLTIYISTSPKWNINIIIILLHNISYFYNYLHSYIILYITVYTIIAYNLYKFNVLQPTLYNLYSYIITITNMVLSCVRLLYQGGH